MFADTKNNRAHSRSWIYNLAEVLLVLLPAFLLIKLTRSWVGDDLIRSFGIVWTANLLMLALIWTSMKIRGQSWKDFGLTFGRFGSKQASKMFGLSLLVFVFAISCYVFGSVLMANIVGMPESADFSRYDFLKDNLGGLLLSLLGVYFISSFGEEVIYRAFLINRFSEMSSNFKYGNTIAVMLSAILFGLIHYEWGLTGMVQTGFMGLAMGIAYIKLKKRLWILVFAHMYMDTLLLVPIYLANN
ncbi:MAG: lysostaphin resistance A-like protein [Flavobacteriaceae bacterium]